VVSSLNQYTPVTVAADGSADPLAFLRDTYIRSLTAYLNAAYDVDALTASLHAAGHPDPDPTAFAKHVNFLGPVDIEPETRDAARTGIQWRRSTQRSGPNFHLVLAVGRGVLIGVGASCGYLPGDGPARLAASIEGGLLDIAHSSRKTLDEVRLDPVRPID
jgi:hypothetical protein